MNEYKQQFHLFKVFTTAENTTASAAGTVYSDCVVPFPVKTMRFNFTYAISANALINFLVSCPVVEGNTVGTLAKYQYLNGAAYWSSDGFRQDTTFTHTFEKPKTIQNSIPLKFTNLTGATINSAAIVSHIEFLG